MSYPPFLINPYPDDPVFGKLWQMFRDAAPDYEWESYGAHDADHKVFVRRGQEVRAVGFAHELAQFTPEKLAQLLALYFD